MRFKTILLAVIVTVVFVTGCGEKYRWAVHDPGRPRPEVVGPAENIGRPPSDAVVLFDGTDLLQWEMVKDGSAGKWKVENGYMEVVKETGDLQTKQSFGDCQLHIEWATPKQIKGKGQGRGNSGVFLMGRYEVQILDSYDNSTYADGQAAAIYGQSPPLVNACREPGQWQSYDIIFNRPIFKGKRVVKPGMITVLQNGVSVQANWVIKGTSFHKTRSHYEPHADKLPIKLQDHGNPMRFRNIWIREL